MTSAAGHAARRGEVLDEYIPHPSGFEHALGCPNCKSVDDLYLIERIEFRRSVGLVDVGVTDPEVDYDVELEDMHQQDDPIDFVVGTREIVGIGCSRCRYSFTGSSPLSRAVKP